MILLLERGPDGLIGEDDSAAVHLPGAEKLRPPRPLPAASRFVCGRRCRGIGRGWTAGGGAGDGALDGEVAVLLRVIVEPRQLCNQLLSSQIRGEGSSSSSPKGE